MKQTLVVLFSLFATGILHGRTKPQLPIDHVIVIVQENRTPDNLFGADAGLINAGAHLVGTGNCKGTAVPMFSWQLDACFDPDHSHKPSWLNTYDGGAMDGSCTISSNAGNCTHQKLPACPNSKYAVCPEYSIVDNSTGLLNPYFQLAAQYGFANYMFQTNQGPSFPAHQFLFSGSSEPIAPTTPYYRWFAAENHSSGSNYGCIASAKTVIKEVNPVDGSEAPGYKPPGSTAGFPCYEHRTMSDLLDAAGIGWRYYTNGAGSLWTAPDAISHICQPNQPAGGKCTGPAFQPEGNVQENPGQVLLDLGVNGTSTRNCQLPPVSWVIPDGNWSDHPGTVGHDGGPSWVSAIVNAVGGYDNSGNPLPVQCNYWAHTVILITWDDWGGFYDDVNPIELMGAGYRGSNDNGIHYTYGFRVPLLVVSTFAKPGYISGPPSNPTCPNYYCHDFGSILNFIEFTFGLGEIGYSNWHYADHFTQDAGSSPNNYSLYDFFNFSQQQTFVPITGAKYATTCFLKPTTCFADYPADPDKDAEEGNEDPD